MADYIYLLESRLSGAQQSALLAVRELARSRGLTVFLVGGAVRDLASGSPVRDLDVVVQGNALKIKKDIEKTGAQISGEYEPMQSLYLRFPGNVRMELSSTLDVTYPKPGKPAIRPASIQEDLRRRDFTANAMALSLNDGSYGLLMDPLNGVADIENRELRLVSNYGFLEDPVRMIRAARLRARLGWQLEERTQNRYDTGKVEGYISALSDFQRGYELEEIVHEEDPLRVLERLDTEGWMKVLCPAWTVAKVNAPELEKLRETQAQLQMQGVVADPSAVQFPLLTARMAPKDVAGLKKLFPRPGFVREIEALESEGRQLAAELGSKQAASPSAAWRMIMSAPPEVVLWVAYTTRSATLQAKFRSFYTEWPQARQHIPYALMQEMRILPELAGYEELVERLFFELMDARLGTPEEMKAFLEPHSPPAPPPPVHLRRARPAKSPRIPKGKKRPETDAEDGAESSVPDERGAGASVLGGPDASGQAGEAKPAEDVHTESGRAVPVKIARAGAPGKASPKAAPPKPAPVKAAPAKAAPVKAAPAKTVSAQIKPARSKAPSAAKPGAAGGGASAKAGGKGAAKTAAVAGKKPVAAKTGPAKKQASAKKPAGKGTAVAAKSAQSSRRRPKEIKKPVKTAGKPAKKVAKAAGGPSASRGKAAAKKHVLHKKSKKR